MKMFLFFDGRQLSHFDSETKYRKVFICCRGYYQNWQIFCPKFTKQNLSFITATIQGRLLFKGGN